MSELLAPLLEWLQAHSGWAGFVLFLIALGESLALVGLFVPGAMLMFGAGALIASGHLSFWPTMVCAAAGAVAGDGISFWLGRRFDRRLAAMWPFRRNPQLLQRAVDFFRRHGGKSVLLGRFVGPIRPVIPAVAGMLGMPVGRFLAINVASALLWAPAYLVPGMVFAASLTLAAEVLLRLVVIVAAVLLAGWVLYRVTHRSLRLIILVLSLVSSVLVAAGLALETARLRDAWDGQAARSLSDWREQPWQGVPRRRFGLFAGNPFELQLLGSRDRLQAALTESGWRPVEPEVGAALLGWLSPEVRASRLAPLPRLHLGRMPEVVALRTDGEQARWVLRAWPSGVTVGPKRRPVWLVSLEREALSENVLWISASESPESVERVREVSAGLLDRLKGAYRSAD